jgi:hypothetical protein
MRKPLRKSELAKKDDFHKWFKAFLDKIIFILIPFLVLSDMTVRHSIGIHKCFYLHQYIRHDNV